MRISIIWYKKELTSAGLIAGLSNLTMKFTDEWVRKVVAEIRICETQYLSMPTIILFTVYSRRSGNWIFFTGKSYETVIVIVFSSSVFTIRFSIAFLFLSFQVRKCDKIPTTKIFSINMTCHFYNHCLSALCVCGYTFMSFQT